MLLYALIRATAWLTQRLPLSFCYWLADRGAEATYWLWPRGRRNMADNMRHVLGRNASDAEINARATAALRLYVRYLVDFLLSPGFSADEAMRRVRFDDWGYFEEAKALGKGTIYVGLHMGNWDLGGALLAQSGYPLHAIMETFKNAHLNDWVHGTRTRLGMCTIPLEEAARGALRALRKGEGIAILMDRPLQPGEGGVDISFFGATAHIPAGAATLAMRTGAPIVSCALVRLPDNTFRGMVQGPYYPNSTGNLQEDIRNLTQQVMDGFARWVEQYPEQWYMFRRMWPTEA